jgi:hypothetical protein
VKNYNITPNSVLPANAQIVFKIFTAVLSRKLNVKFLLASLKTHTAVILQIVPKVASEILFRLSLSLLLVDFHQCICHIVSSCWELFFSKAGGFMEQLLQGVSRDFRLLVFFMNQFPPRP